MVEKIFNSPIIKEPLDKFVVNNNEFTILENSHAIWGLVINNSLSKAENPINEYRYMSILQTINGNNIQLAQGIWNLEEAKVIASRIQNNKPAIFDYSDFIYNNEKNNFRTRCNKEIVQYLSDKNIFVKNDPIDTKRYQIYYPKLMGEKESVLRINVHILESFYKKYNDLIFRIYSEVNNKDQSK